MGNTVVIDTTYDFTTDARGRDPDSCSPTLRSYHKKLWSKNLPSGDLFELRDDKTPWQYLYHSSHLGNFYLGSDGAIPTFAKKPIAKEIPGEDIESFTKLGCTIGNFMVFPRNQIDGKQTINQVRGCRKVISDRFDLTVECIRRHYSGEESRLQGAIERYSDFFRLFKDFRGYIDFFLLQDIVAPDYAAVDFFLPFDDFKTSAIPQDVASYQAYREKAMRFIRARNERIRQWAEDQTMLD
jgi:hypothetical protein